jgi:hypothetical protein
MYILSMPSQGFLIAKKISVYCPPVAKFRLRDRKETGSVTQRKIHTAGSS